MNVQGKWSPPTIKNPAYKGKWSARIIPNPNYYEANPYSQLAPVTAIGFELWTMSENILFDNILITDDATLGSDFAAQTFKIKNNLESILEQAENPSRNILQNLLDATDEKPWLWGVYILCVLIPMIALSAYFYGRKSSPTGDDAKKTDAYQPDDEEEEKLVEENVEEEEEQPGPSGSRHSSRRVSNNVLLIGLMVNV
jgi:calnexin